MELVIKSRDEDRLDEYDYKDGVEYHADGEIILSFYDGEPEDNNLSRNFRYAFNISSLAILAWKAGLKGEALNITHEDLED